MAVSGSCSDLSILCVTRGERCVQSLLASLIETGRDLNAECVIVADGDEAEGRLMLCNELWGAVRIVAVGESRGCIEDVLDGALAYTTRKYILRVDDDERISKGMYEWLRRGGYRVHPHWKFPRAHAWQMGGGIGGDWLDPTTPAADLCCIVNPPLWPDHQTRLSVREMAGDRRHLHCGSPFGGGETAPCLIEHHKFVIKTLSQRRDIVHRYDKIQDGMGQHFKVFSVPEEVIDDKDVELMSLADLERSIRGDLSQ